MDQHLLMFQQCKHSSTMLLNLINDLLDLAKQERLSFQLEKSYFNLIDTIRNSFDTLNYLANLKKVKTKLMVDPNQIKHFEEIFSDEGRFEQIFLNFISNAIKFTKEGTTVEVVLKSKKSVALIQLEELEDNSTFERHLDYLMASEEQKDNLQFNQFEIEITDQGHGISKEEINALF